MIIKASNIVGSQAELARLMGVTSMAVTKWVYNGVPAERVLAIEKLCKGKVTRHQLRPDIYPK